MSDFITNFKKNYHSEMENVTPFLQGIFFVGIVMIFVTLAVLTFPFGIFACVLYVLYKLTKITILSLKKIKTDVDDFDDNQESTEL